MFNKYDDAIAWIESVKRFGDKLDLSRMEIACQLLGNPEKSLHVIHVAGTNGKGSTVSYVKEILLEEGYNVGTFTSPYIVRFNERITYNHNDISNDNLLYYINKVKALHDQVLQDHHEVITFFELVTLMSFLFFKDHPCDFVIYEVGLGGRLDATNVVNPLLCAITSISFDHMGVLGDTLESIALNKLGIVKEGIPLITSVQEESLLPLFTKYTKDKNALLTLVNRQDVTNVDYETGTRFQYKGHQYRLTMLGDHQINNAILSLEIIMNLEERGLCKTSQKSKYNGLNKAHWPGRLEQFGSVFLDGAHNIGGAIALSRSLQLLFSDKKIKVLYATMADKDYEKVIQTLDPHVDEIVFTQFDYPRCEEAEKAFLTCQSHIKHASATYNEDAIQSFHHYRNTLEKNEILLVTGSLYFVSYMRKEC